MASSDIQISKPQSGRHERAELPDVKINTGAQGINSGGTSLRRIERVVPGIGKLVVDGGGGYHLACGC